IDCPLDGLESRQDRRLVGTIELARVDLADRQTDPANCVAKRLCQFLAFVVEVSLLGDVIEVEWVRVGLVRGRRAMPYDDDIAARAQPLDQLLRISSHTVL